MGGGHQRLAARRHLAAELGGARLVELGVEVVEERERRRSALGPVDLEGREREREQQAARLPRRRVFGRIDAVYVQLYHVPVGTDEGPPRPLLVALARGELVGETPAKCLLVRPRHLREDDLVGLPLRPVSARERSL